MDNGVFQRKGTRAHIRQRDCNLLMSNGCKRSKALPKSILHRRLILKLVLCVFLWEFQLIDFDYLSGCCIVPFSLGKE